MEAIYLSFFSGFEIENVREFVPDELPKRLYASGCLLKALRAGPRIELGGFGGLDQCILQVS